MIGRRIVYVGTFTIMTWLHFLILFCIIIFIDRVHQALQCTLLSLLNPNCFRAHGNRPAFPFIIKHTFPSYSEPTYSLEKYCTAHIVASPYTDNDSFLNFAFAFPSSTRHFIMIRCSIFVLISMFDKNRHVQLLNILRSFQNQGYTQLVDLRFRIHKLDWCRTMSEHGN